MAASASISAGTPRVSANRQQAPLRLLRAMPQACGMSAEALFHCQTSCHVQINDSYHGSSIPAPANGIDAADGIDTVCCCLYRVKQGPLDDRKTKASTCKHCAPPVAARAPLVESRLNHHTHTHTHTPCLTKNKSQLTNCSSPPHFGIQIPIPSTMTIPQPRKARIPQPRKAEDGSWTQSHKSWVFAENVHAVVQELEVSWARAGGIKLRAAERDVLLLRLQPRWVRARLSLLACTRRLKVPATATVHPSPWFWLRGTSSRRR